jgi:hypothetical protein
MKKRFFHEMTVVADTISTSDSFTKSRAMNKSRILLRNILITG